MMKYPRDTNGQYLPLLLWQEYPEICKGNAVYVDVWPVSEPMFACFNPDMMSQFCQDPSMPKHHHLHNEFLPFTQCNDLVNQDGAEWKKWRAIFNPGFSAKNIMSMIPTMVEEVRVFVGWLEGAAGSGKTVVLEPQAMKLTIDIIGRAVL
jgi:cytochrome P450